MRRRKYAPKPAQDTSVLSSDKLLQTRPFQPDVNEAHQALQLQEESKAFTGDFDLTQSPVFCNPQPISPVGQPLQAKLTIGEPNDKYEQEADRVAHDVVQGIHETDNGYHPLGQLGKHADAVRRKAMLQREAMLNEEDELQMKPLVQRKEFDDDAVSVKVEKEINHARGGGQSLMPTLQTQMGQAMGADFSGVRVHADARADMLNRAVGARAFTTGQDLFFKRGEYQPRRQVGQELIAHELTHVVQQKREKVQRSPFHLQQYSEQIPSRTFPISSEQNAIQMVREDEFRNDPEVFLQNNVLSLTMEDGLRARANDLNIDYGQFLRVLASFNKHWFKLIPDANRTTEAQNAYILTPAIEKYAAAYPADQILSPLLLEIGEKLPLEDDASYITSAYVDYKNIGVGDSYEESIGHTDITRDRDADADFNPDFVFTAAMNGCAFSVTPSEDESKFRAWHYQSPSSNPAKASTFRQTKNPMDWFGEEEYDDGNHEGLFEVTNFLHRGADNQWKVISQQNETSASSMNDISIKNVSSRSLNLAEPDLAGIVKRIYTSLQLFQNQLIRKSVSNAQKYKLRFKPILQQSLDTLGRMINTLLDEEEAAIAGANSLQELNATAQKILKTRGNNIPFINQASDSLVEYLESQYKIERDKWEIFQDKEKIKDIDLAINNIAGTAGISTTYAKTVWVEKLVQESTLTL